MNNKLPSPNVDHGCRSVTVKTVNYSPAENNI